MIDTPILSLLIWLPIAGGMALLVMDSLGTPDIRPTALVVSIITFLFSILIYTGFDTSTAAMQFSEQVRWIELSLIHI